jgi:hypothetical protein
MNTNPGFAFVCNLNLIGSLARHDLFLNNSFEVNNDNIRHVRHILFKADESFLSMPSGIYLIYLFILLVLMYFASEVSYYVGLHV